MRTRHREAEVLAAARFLAAAILVLLHTVLQPAVWLSSACERKVGRLLDDA
jgi:hypothetical protein